MYVQHKLCKQCNVCIFSTTMFANVKFHPERAGSSCKEISPLLFIQQQKTSWNNVFENIHNTGSVCSFQEPHFCEPFILRHTWHSWTHTPSNLIPVFFYVSLTKHFHSCFALHLSSANRLNVQWLFTFLITLWRPINVQSKMPSTTVFRYQ